MSKINRYNGDVPIFAQNATANYLFNFGQLDDADWDGELSSMMNNAFQVGWETVNPSEYPPKQWFNSAMRAMSQSTAYLYQMGIPEWNADQRYFVGSKCQVAGTTYTSLTDDNVGNEPSSDAENWGSLERTFLRLWAFKPAFLTLVGHPQLEQYTVQQLGQKLYESEYQTSYAAVAAQLGVEGSNVIDDTEKQTLLASSTRLEQMKGAASYGIGSDENGNYFTVLASHIYLHNKPAGTYGNAGDVKEDHMQNAEGYLAIKMTTTSTYAGLALNTGVFKQKTIGGAAASVNASTTDVTVTDSANTASFDLSQMVRTDALNYTDTAGAFFPEYIYIPKGVY